MRKEAESLTSGWYGTMPPSSTSNEISGRSTRLQAHVRGAATTILFGAVALCSYCIGRRHGAVELMDSSSVPLPLVVDAHSSKHATVRQQLDGPDFGEIALPPGYTSAPEQSSLWKVFELIKTKEFVDLTHSFSPEIPHWKGFEAEEVKTLYTLENDGFWAEQFCHVGQWGTHVDPPAHFADGARTADLIEPKEMFLPLVVLDVHEACEQNPDYVLTMDDVRGWEVRHGQLIPEGAFVAMRTDWSKRWPDAAAMDNKDEQGVPHYPAWSMEVLQYLYEERKITASGHETTDTDGGLAVARDDYALEGWILAQDHYQIELLANLDKVPEAGALVVASFPKPKDGSGFPARVFAIVP